MMRHEGDDLPVSAFVGREDGTFPNGTTAYEKKGGYRGFDSPVATGKLHSVQSVFFRLPHAVIRPFCWTGLR